MRSYAARLAALLLALLALGGCTPVKPAKTEPNQPSPPQTSAAPSEQPEEKPTALRVAYDLSENLNPFTTGSLQNYYLAQLLYDPLYRLDENYRAEKCLAQSYTVAVDYTVDDEGLAYERAVCRLRIKEGVRFWDGAELTAADVVYSLQQAMVSPYYAAGLTHVASVEADGEDPLTLTIQLTRPDAFFEKSLTFPIIKNATGSYNRPVGCGRFQPVNLDTFEPNPDHSPAVTTFETIELVPVSDMSAAAYSIKTGLIDLAASDLSIPWNRSLGNSYTSVQLSNMVYLGVNKGGGALASQEFRSVVYRLLDRIAIDEPVYLGQDTASWLPFNPAVYEVGSQATVMPGQLTQRGAGTLLDGLGYDQRDQNGYRTRGGQYLSITILVNSENAERVVVAQSVAYALEQVGIRAVVEQCSFEEYRARLAANSYDLFVGEVRLPWNMNVLPMLEARDETGYGAAAGEQLQQAAREFLRTGKGLDQFSQLFTEEVPFIPLFFRQGIVAFPLNFCPNLIATEQDIFYNIESWELS